MLEDKNLPERLEGLSKDEKIQLYLEMLDTDYFRALAHINNEFTVDKKYSYYDRFLSVANVEFFDEVAPYLSDLPVSNGRRLFKKLALNVGIICDEFLYHSMRDAAHLTYINADGEGLDSTLDFLIVATTWKGIDSSWRYVATPGSKMRGRLYELIDKAKGMDIPVIFYSKEDPVNFHQFKEIATYCDSVFTSALEVIDMYIDYCGHDRVYPLEFGVNPLYHNPVGSRTPYADTNNKDHVIFAGSWTEKYPIRNVESARIFDGVIDAGSALTIFDRNLNLQKPRYHFPSKYIEYLTYPVEHEDLMHIHRLYRWGINVNSVKYSETMFANRVYELQALGNIVLSNYSMGINNTFPHVFIINKREDVVNILKYQSERDLEDIRAKGIRQVMLHHTGVHRLMTIANAVGQNVSFKEPKILVIGASESSLIRESFERQHYKQKAFKLASMVDDEVLRHYDFVTYFSDAYIYEEHHLEDLLAGFVYTDVDFITKDRNVMHDYVDTCKDKYVTLIDVNALNTWDDHGALTLGYAIPKTEMFKASEEAIAKKWLSVIVPIHNNGRFLEDKCMRSLVRSTVFKHMEIILVDDGSSDNETLSIIKRLKRRYPSLKYVRFDSGSGSASRPRNAGISHATAPYVTFLDPDNEALGDGYADLIDKLLEDSSIDMVVGNILKEDHETRKKFSYYGTVLQYNEDNPLITDTLQFMEDCGLRAQSIQAMIVKREILTAHTIRMVEGAAGQDTLFFQEVMLKCNKVLAVDTYVHVYYAAVLGSVTNTLGVQFFEKYYTLEVERIKFLETHQLMESYLKKRFNFYIKNWYLSRIERTKPSERRAAIERFLDIYHMYDRFEKYKVKDPEIILAVERLTKEITD